jgi:hypothetical protein
MRLPDAIPSKLRFVAISLKDLGLGEVAWRARDALAVIESLRGTPVAITGADLYRVEAWGIAPLTEGWHCDRLRGEMASQYAERSRGLAAECIADREARSGQEVVYALLFTLQQDAA